MLDCSCVCLVTHHWPAGLFRCTVITVVVSLLFLLVPCARQVVKV